MMQKPEITFEVEETVVLKQGGKLLTGFCPRCSEMVAMLSPDVLSLVTGISEREIFQFVENDVIHFIESDGIVACPSCLQRTVKEQGERIQVGTNQTNWQKQQRR